MHWVCSGYPNCSRSHSEQRSPRCSVSGPAVLPAGPKPEPPCTQPPGAPHVGSPALATRRPPRPPAAARSRTGPHSPLGAETQLRRQEVEEAGAVPLVLLRRAHHADGGDEQLGAGLGRARQHHGHPAAYRHVHPLPAHARSRHGVPAAPPAAPGPALTSAGLPRMVAVASHSFRGSPGGSRSAGRLVSSSTNGMAASCAPLCPAARRLPLAPPGPAPALLSSGPLLLLPSSPAAPRAQRGPREGTGMFYFNPGASAACAAFGAGRVYHGKGDDVLEQLAPQESKRQAGRLIVLSHMNDSCPGFCSYVWVPKVAGVPPGTGSQLRSPLWIRFLRS